MDLAIVDDENPGKYILGITTDGKMYASSKVARDRDRLREQVLKGLGWKLYHLWSTDWYRNRDLGRKRLLEAVEIAIKETREEEKRKSEEAKKLAEKRKKEAEKLAEELRLAKQKELEEQKENEKSTSDIGEDENIEVIPPEEDLEFNENKNDSSDVEDDDYLFEGNSTESESGEDEVSDVEVILPEEDDDSEFEESVVSDVGVVSSEEDDDSLKSKKEDFSEVKEESSQESINDETKDIKDKNKSKKSLSKGFGISSIFKSKKKNAGKNTEKINDIKFSKNIENEDELDLKNDKIDSKPEEKAEDVKVNAKNSDNDNIDSKEDELKASEPKEDINRDNDDIDSKEDELKSKEEVNESFDEEVNPIESDNKKSKNNSIKSIFFDNERLENKEHGTIASAIIGKSKLEKEEIETVGGEIMENENPKLHRPTPKDEYVVEPEIIDENSQDGEKLYENLKFKSNVDLDDEDIHNVASDIVANAFEEVISDINNEKDIEVNIIDKDNYQDYDDENQYTQQDDNISQETSTTSTSVNQDDYYQGVSGITNPLKKNNIYHKTNDNKNKSVKDSLVDLKNEVKYINKSLKEIENPTPAEYVAVIDRTEEYNPDDYITPEHDEDEYVFSNDETEELTFAEAEEKRYEQEKLMEALKKEIASDENVIIPIHEEKRRQQMQDQALEDIIQTANEDYVEIEKERFKNNNTLKAFDDKKLPGKVKLKDEIAEYKQAEDIGLTSQEDLFKKSSEEVAKSIDKIVKIEGPVHVSEVIKRVKDSCNIKRAGANLKKAVNGAISASEDAGNIIKIGDFLYDSASNDVCIRKRHKPNIDLISDEEIAKNIERILVHKQSISAKTLPKEVSRNFGFKSTSKKTANKINSVLDLMIADNKVKLDNDTLELK